MVVIAVVLYEIFQSSHTLRGRCQYHLTGASQGLVVSERFSWPDNKFIFINSLYFNFLKQNKAVNPWAHPVSTFGNIWLEQRFLILEGFSLSNIRRLVGELGLAVRGQWDQLCKVPSDENEDEDEDDNNDNDEDNDNDYDDDTDDAVGDEDDAL